VKLGTTADMPMIREFKPDAVVLGTGGLTAVPAIPGIDNRKVVRSEELHRMLKRTLKFFGPKTLEKLTKVWMPLGKRVVIIGGGIQGFQLAHFLTLRKRKVTIVDTADVLGEGIPFQVPLRYLKWFEQEGVALRPGVTYEKITDDGLIIKTKDGTREVLAADSIILTLPLMPDNSFYNELQKEVTQVFQIGDCREFGLMHGAIADGAEVGRAV
jgi:2,4-dienoyl-CoA reductase (NADPH2)